ncbi:MAG: ABC transporter permease [Saprospiraceae bacterium]
MIKNYLKVAVRNLLKQRGLSLINILGLSLGLACFSMFLLYAVNELTYDRQHENGANIFRVYRWTEPLDGLEARGDAHLPMPLGPAMKEDLPDVEAYVRFRTAWGQDFVRANGQIQREFITFADPNVFNVFSFPMKYGVPETALDELQSIVLTKSTAIRLFGEENPTGKTLDIKLEDSFQPFTVTAVVEDIPSNSTIDFNVLANYQYLASKTRSGERYQGNWNRSAFMTFVQLKPGSGLPNAPDRLSAFRKKYYPDEEKNLREEGRWTEAGAPVNYRLQPITEMHTNTAIPGGFTRAIDPKNIWILLSIAAGVLLIACINFTTLSIGRSAGRAREVGVRKVIGGSRKSLTAQFLTESLLLAVLSSGIGLGLVYLLLPAFNQMADRELVFSMKQYPELGWLIGGLTLLVGLLAGSYPAIVMSGFRPVEVLKAKVRLNGANLFTKSLVTFQFVLSIGLIASTMIILQQINLMHNQYPGFNKENVVVVNADGTDVSRVWPRFKAKMERRSDVLGVTGTEASIGASQGYSRSGFMYGDQPKSLYEYFVDENYLSVLDIPLVAGRNFDPNVSADTLTSVIFNESAVKDFGWTNEEAIGKPLTGYTQDTERTPIIIGVVKDFNFFSFRDQVEPQLFHQFHDYQPFRFLVRIPAGDPAAVLSGLEQEWNAIVPDYPFSYSFLDDDVNNFYEAEERWGTIVAWAGGMAIFLACLGLLGLAALAAANRTKEIGIRKVLGASLTGIVTLLSKDFVRLVAIALVLAVPLAWYFMQRWLENFAYRIDIHWWVFALVGAVAMLIAFATVGFQGIRAALNDPVKSLRSE